MGGGVLVREGSEGGVLEFEGGASRCVGVRVGIHSGLGCYYFGGGIVVVRKVPVGVLEEVYVVD